MCSSNNTEKRNKSMKKGVLIVLSCLIFLCSCGKKHPDFVTSNTGEAELCNPIIPSGNGYYYNDQSDMKKPGLKYYDIKTQKSIYLCSHPECLHDGNDFCNATSEKYIYLGMAGYEDKLYVEVLEYDDKKEEACYKLMRAEKDGSGLSEISSFAKQETKEIYMVSSLGADNPVIHRGKAYLYYRLAPEESIPTYGIAEVDLYSGKSKSIFEEQTEANLYSISASNNDLFFIFIRLADNKFEYDLYHYDIEKEKTDMMVCPQNYPRAGTALNGKYYYVADGNETPGNKCGLYCYDPASGESKFLENALSDYLAANLVDVKLKYDGKYWYAGKTLGDDVETYLFAIFSDSFEKLAETEIKGEGMDYSLDILDGIVYIQDEKKVVNCPTEDILNGNIHWDGVFQFDKKVNWETEEDDQ